MPPFSLKASILILAATGLFLTGLSADEARPETIATKTATLTFYVAGVECPACVYTVNDSIRRVDGVEEVAEGQANEHYSNVTFDPRKVSAQQIAQAVTEAFPLHGAPYQASLKLRLPEYARAGNAARVTELFAKWKEAVKAEVTDPARGEIVIRFLALPEAPGQAGPRGWSHAPLIEALRAPAPKGLGLAVSFATEG
jgi:copper chaperone CopZ